MSKGLPKASREAYLKCIEELGGEKAFYEFLEEKVSDPDAYFPKLSQVIQKFATRKDIQDKDAVEEIMGTDKFDVKQLRKTFSSEDRHLVFSKHIFHIYIHNIPKKMLFELMTEFVIEGHGEDDYEDFGFQENRLKRHIAKCLKDNQTKIRQKIERHRDLIGEKGEMKGFAHELLMQPQGRKVRAMASFHRFCTKLSDKATKDQLLEAVEDLDLNVSKHNNKEEICRAIYDFYT